MICFVNDLGGGITVCQTIEYERDLGFLSQFKTHFHGV